MTATLLPDIPRVTHDTARETGLAAAAQLVDLLKRLEPAHWDARTECPEWTVADMVGHMIGAAKSHVSRRESIRQLVHGFRNAKAHGGNSLDAMNALQVADHRHLDAEARLALLEELLPKSIGKRTSRNVIERKLPIPLDGGKGSMMTGLPATVSMGTLMDVIYTRDLWLHAVDIERATGVKADRTGDIDRIMVHDVVADWMEGHGQPVTLHLTGPAGGSFASSTGARPEMTLDAIEWARTVSGREEGQGLLAHPVLF